MIGLLCAGVISLLVLGLAQAMPEVAQRRMKSGPAVDQDLAANLMTGLAARRPTIGQGPWFVLRWRPRGGALGRGLRWTRS